MPPVMLLEMGLRPDLRVRILHTNDPEGTYVSVNTIVTSIAEETGGTVGTKGVTNCS